MKSVGKVSEKINWFPGHMRKALRHMQEHTVDTDIFLEVRDARLPYSTRNPQFDPIVKAAHKHKLIVFNKADLCDPIKTLKVIQDYNEYGIPSIAISSQKHDDMRQLVGLLKDKYTPKYKQVGLWMMAYGMPNVGKSSLLNQLRSISDLEKKGSTSKVSSSVCTTKGTKGFKMLQNPLMFMMDSPGVSVPSVIPIELGLKLALIGVIKEQVVDKVVLLEFMMESL